MRTPTRPTPRTLRYTDSAPTHTHTTHNAHVSTTAQPTDPCHAAACPATPCHLRLRRGYPHEALGDHALGGFDQRLRLSRPSHRPHRPLTITSITLDSSRHHRPSCRHRNPRRLNPFQPTHLRLAACCLRALIRWTARLAKSLRRSAEPAATRESALPHSVELAQALGWQHQRRTSATIVAHDPLRGQLRWPK